MVDLRVVYTAMLKGSIEYILEDIEEPKLFEMVSIIAKLAEQSAHARMDKKRQEEYQAVHESYTDVGSALNPRPVSSPTQSSGSARKPSIYGG